MSQYIAHVNNKIYENRQPTKLKSIYIVYVVYLVCVQTPNSPNELPPSDSSNLPHSIKI